MAAILAPVFTPATRTQCPKYRNMIQMPMRLKRNPMTDAVKRKSPTGNLMVNLIGTSTRQLKNPSCSATVRYLTLQKLSGNLIRKTFCQIATSFWAQSSQARIQATLHSMGAWFVMEQGPCFARGLWRRDCKNYDKSLCMMPRPKSLRNTIPGQFPVFDLKQWEHLDFFLSLIYLFSIIFWSSNFDWKEYNSRRLTDDC